MVADDSDPSMVEIKPGKALGNLGKGANDVHACLVYERGIVDFGGSACERCAAGYGVFANCVKVPGHASSICATCMYQGHKCSDELVTPARKRKAISNEEGQEHTEFFGGQHTRNAIYDEIQGMNLAELMVEKVFLDRAFADALKSSCMRIKACGFYAGNTE